MDMGTTIGPIIITGSTDPIMDMGTTIGPTTIMGIIGHTIAMGTTIVPTIGMATQGTVVNTSGVMVTERSDGVMATEGSGDFKGSVQTVGRRTLTTGCAGALNPTDHRFSFRSSGG